eukprot:XP_013984303.1 PREDICTED: thyroid hormone-induced protein B-like isoform X2 [Salmo salar]
MLPFYLFTLFAIVQAQNRPLPGSCSFESSTCGYTSDPDFTSWTLNKDGYCISMDPGQEYQNRQEKRPEGEERSEGEGRGVLLSPAMEQEDWSCLRLMYQLSVSGSLQVQLRREGESFDWTLWNTQTASDSWLISSIDLQDTTEPYRIVFEAIKGSSIRSDIAIDNIVFESGPCPDIEVKMTHSPGNATDIE